MELIIKMSIPRPNIKPQPPVSRGNRLDTMLSKDYDGRSLTHTGEQSLQALSGPDLETLLTSSCCRLDIGVLLSPPRARSPALSRGREQRCLWVHRLCRGSSNGEARGGSDGEQNERAIRHHQIAWKEGVRRGQGKEVCGRSVACSGKTARDPREVLWVGGWRLK